MKKLFVLFVFMSIIGAFSLYAQEVTSDTNNTDVTLDDTGIEANAGETSVDLEWDQLDVNVEGNDIDITGDEINIDELEEWEEIDETIQLRVKDVKENEATLEFDVLPGYTDYKVFYSQKSIAEAQPEEILETTTTVDELAETGSVTISGLEPNSTYYAVIVALTNDWEKYDASMSEEVTINTQWPTIDNIDTNIENNIDNNHWVAKDVTLSDIKFEIKNKEVTATFTPWLDTKKVLVYVSDDPTNFVNKVWEVDAMSGSYTFMVDNYWTKYVKLVPVDEMWIAWEVSEPQKIVVTDPSTRMWTPKTGPELYMLVVVAILAYVGYIYKRRLS